MIAFPAPRITFSLKFTLFASLFSCLNQLCIGFFFCAFFCSICFVFVYWFVAPSDVHVSAPISNCYWWASDTSQCQKCWHLRYLTRCFLMLKCVKGSWLPIRLLTDLQFTSFDYTAWPSSTSSSPLTDLLPVPVPRDSTYIQMLDEKLIPMQFWKKFIHPLQRFAPFIYLFLRNTLRCISKMLTSCNEVFWISY